MNLPFQKFKLTTKSMKHVKSNSCS